MSITTRLPALPITLSVSEDGWKGDAQFVVLANGRQVGGVRTATANHSKGNRENVTPTSDFDGIPETLTVCFLNDAWGGTAATDRNLYVNSVSVNGTTYNGSSASNAAGGLTAGTAAFLHTAGSVTFDLGPLAAPATRAAGSVTLQVAEDAWQGDAQFIVLADGRQVGGVQSATASHSDGKWQSVTLPDDIGPNLGSITVCFLNDAWGGTAATDRNLYVNSITVNGATYQGNSASNSAGGLYAGTAVALHTTGSITFDLPKLAPAPTPAASAAKFGPNAYISAGRSLQYDSNQSWSASATVSIVTLPTPYAWNLPEGGANLIFGNTNGAPYSGYEMWVDCNGHLRVRIMQNFLEGKYIDVSGTTNIVDGHLLSVGASYDGSFAAAGVKLFIDGRQEATQTLKDTLAGSSWSDGPMIIGNQLNGWEDQFDLKGEMTSFMLSDQVKPATYFDPANTAFDQIDLHAQLAYRFQEGTGLVTKDLSGHGHDGILSSMSIWSTL